MSEISKKVAYIKGMAEGMELTADTAKDARDKLLLQMLDALDLIAEELDSIRDRQDEAERYIDELDSDLGELEEAVFEEDDDDEDEDCGCGCHHHHGQDEDEEWEYHVEAICKHDEASEPPSDDTVRRKVLKLWDDSGNRDQRPAYVRVQLLRNGRVVDTVRLSEDNNWQYTWNDLDADARWQVVEDQVPDGYTVSIDREGITFVITNTYPPEEPDRPPRPDEPEEPDEPDEPHLPQTGQLWWPVWALGFCGGAMIAAGLLVRHRRHDNES